MSKLTLKSILRQIILEADEKPATDDKTKANPSTGDKVKADPATENELKKILKKDYPTFVKELGDNIKDPKFQAAIKSLSDQHPVKFATINAKVSELKPTQNEIDVDKSLKFPLQDVKTAKAYLAGGNVAPAGKRIITCGGGKYIIDGHHRWSQVAAMNPNCTIAALDLSDITDPFAALKATQLGIAGDIGKIPVAKVKGSNLLVMAKDALIEYVKKI